MYFILYFSLSPSLPLFLSPSPSLPPSLSLPLSLSPFPVLSSFLISTGVSHLMSNGSCYQDQCSLLLILSLIMIMMSPTLLVTRNKYYNDKYILLTFTFMSHFCYQYMLISPWTCLYISPLF